MEKNLKNNKYVCVYVYVRVCVYIYMHSWITFLYIWNEHNIVNQLYFNNNFKILKI